MYQDLASLETGAQPTEMIDHRQIRMARIGLGWTAEDLARETRLGLATIRRAEAGKPPGVTEGTLYVIQHTLEAGGVVFIDAGPDGGPGVRLRGQRQ